MRIWLTLALGLLLLAAPACKDAGSAGRPAMKNARQFAMIFDIPCKQVQQQVRKTMKANPGLGLAKEREAPLGVALITPVHKGDQRRWWATVLVQCADPQTARLEVQVKAERKVEGAWQPAGDAPGLEKKILDKVTPTP